MKKLIMLLSVLGLLFSCGDIDVSKYDKDNEVAAEGYVNWSIAKIGDKFNIAKVTTATDTTIDLTDFGFGVSGGSGGTTWDNQQVNVKYITSTIANDYIDIITLGNYWDSYQANETKTTRFYDTNNLYIATAIHTDGTVDFTVPIIATNVMFDIMTTTDAVNGGSGATGDTIQKKFVLKGLNDGTGEVTVTGVTTTTYDGRPPVSEGDVDMNTPLQ